MTGRASCFLPEGLYRVRVPLRAFACTYARPAAQFPRERESDAFGSIFLISPSCFQINLQTNWNKVSPAALLRTMKRPLSREEPPAAASTPPPPLRKGLIAMEEAVQLRDDVVGVVAVDEALPAVVNEPAVDV